MKMIFYIFCAVLSYSAVAQKNVGLELRDGKILVLNDTLQFVKGSIGGKTYRYVYIDQSRLTGNTMLTSQFDGQVVWIKGFKKEKDKKSGEKIDVVMLDGMNPFKVECDINNAIKTGELKIISGIWKQK